ncbi:MAG: Do family serine endopeptidase [Deltaproteobacteria bacterium]|nr:Do family serine endopeptidase [Deltaproteobacteria bacterium]
MRKILLVVGLGLVVVPARADRLWMEKSADEAKRDQVLLPSAAPLIKKASAAVVNIMTNGKPPPGLGNGEDGNPFDEFFKRFHGGREIPRELLRGAGTGFLIHPTGYIVTNAHVVEDAASIEVRLLDDDTPRPAKVIGQDSTTDLALIKIDGKDLPVLPLGDSDALEVGDFVLAIGNPFGLAHSASFGMVSAKGRKEINPSGRSGLYDFIQTDAAINPGNSGGPLVNLRGEVVGINAAVNAAGQGIGFAIPVNMAKQLLPDLKEKGSVTRSWLGLNIQKVTPELAQSFGLESPRGALVAGVVEDGPSAKAGVEPGDVIVEFDGKKVVHSVDLPLMAATAGVGKSVPVKVMRDGKEKSVKVILTARPDDTTLARANSRSGGEARDLGIRVVELGAMRQQLGLAPGFKGIVVKEVEADSPAAQAGLRAGDVIVKFNGKPVESVAHFVSAARGVKEGQMVRLFVRRGDTGLFLAFKR